MKLKSKFNPELLLLFKTEKYFYFLVHLYYYYRIIFPSTIMYMYTKNILSISWNLLCKYNFILKIFPIYWKNFKNEIIFAQQIPRDAKNIFSIHVHNCAWKYNTYAQSEINYFFYYPNSIFFFIKFYKHQNFEKILIKNIPSTPLEFQKHNMYPNLLLLFYKKILSLLLPFLGVGRRSFSKYFIFFYSYLDFKTKNFLLNFFCKNSNRHGKIVFFEYNLKEIILKEISFSLKTVKVQNISHLCSDGTKKGKEIKFFKKN
jgi:hypothetical protein